MMRIYRVLVLVVVLYSALGEPSVDVDTFLEKYGYLKKIKQGKARDPSERQNSIRQYQKNYGLKETGEINKETLEQMVAPRCGMPDIFRPSNAPAKFRTPGLKWDKTTLRYKILNKTKDLPSGSVSKAIKKGFTYWTEVSRLHAIATNSESADLKISFHSGNHGDGAENAFDKAGGVLAHAYFPSDGRIHFDEAEKWTEKSEQGVNLEIVAAHEIGHALGLDHSFIRGTLMFPSYQGYEEKFRLHSDDIAGIRHLYGNAEKPAATTTKKPVQGPKKKNKICGMSGHNAAFQAPDKRLYVFKGKYFYKLSMNKKQSKHVISKRFPRAPKTVTAAVYSEKYKKYFLFKGKMIYHYNTSFKLQNKVKLPANIPYNPDAALAWKDSLTDQYLVIFKGAKFYTYDTISNTASGPHSLSHYFPKLPTRMETAFTWLDKFVYVVKGRRIWKLDPYRRRVIKGYPEPLYTFPSCQPTQGSLISKLSIPKRLPKGFKNLPVPK